MTSNLFISISCLFILAYFTSSAQEVQSVRLTKYTQNDGLSSDYVTKIVQDQYGFIWAGTQEGLNVFDGNSFNIFSNQSKSKRNIGGSLVQDLLEDQERSWLWVQTSFAAIYAFDTESRTIKRAITHDSKNQPYTEIWARCIGLQKDVLWVGGLNTLSAYHIPTQSFLNTDHIEKILVDQGEYNINKITQDSFGYTWLMIDGQGIMVINQSLEIIKSFDLDDLGYNSKKKLFFWDVKFQNQKVLLATSWGLVHFNTGYSSDEIKMIMNIPSQFTQTVVTSLSMVSDSALLLSTTSDVYLYDLKSKKVITLLDEHQQKLTNVYQIYFDEATDFVWLGTQSGLQLFSYSEGPFSSFSKSSDGHQKISHLYALLPVSENDIYAGGSNGIYHIDARTKRIDLLDTASMNFLLFQDQERNTFVSNSANLTAIENRKLASIEKSNRLPDGLQGNLFNAVINYNDSLILLSSFLQKGLSVWNTFSHRICTFHHDSLNSRIPNLRSINYLFKSKGADIYILTDKSIIRFNPLDSSYNVYVIHDPKSKNTLTIFTDMNETENSYFLGTYGDGLIETDKQFKVKKIYTTSDGLSNNCIYRIFNIKDEKLLMTSNNGLSILDLKTRKFRTYYEGDGLHGNGFEQFCGYQKDNKIYVGGPGGFTIVDTDLLTDSRTTPILYPTGIEINTQAGKMDSTDLFMSSFSIPNDAFKTTLKFVAPDYKNADRMTYRYKIQELSEDWVDIGNQNFVDLIGVNPGTYHFQAMATNSEGTDSEPIEIKLDFLPKWYQTAWFKLALLLMVAMLVYFIQKYRMNQLKKQQLIRKEIANDLHDDIGSTLNSLKIFTHLAQSDTNNKKHIEQIGASISEATVGLRDMIWVLEDEQDTVYEIMERIKKFASPLCLASYIELISNVTATSEKAIPKKIKRNIFLIAKEGINNSVKYADCSKIYVTIAYTSSSLKLIIEDNGKGFNMEEITKGKGLDSIEYRAKQVQFECTFQSSGGKGTKIEVSGAPW